MKKIELDHWLIKDSKLSISLMNLYVEIKILVKNNKKIISLKVINEEQNELLFFFNTIEEAMTFTEERLKYCKDFNDVVESYKELNKDNNKKNKMLIKNKDKK